MKYVSNVTTNILNYGGINSMIEMYMNDKQESIIQLANEFIRDNKEIIYKTNNCKAQIHYPLNDIIDNFFKSKGLPYRVYGVLNGIRFSTTRVEVIDISDNYREMGVYFNYKRKLLSKTRTDSEPYTLDQVINGKHETITMQHYMETEEYRAIISFDYDCLVLS